MDMTSIEPNRSIEWDDSIEKILSEIADEAQINAYMHKDAHTYYDRKNIQFQAPVIVLSLVSGSGNFISTNFPDYSNYMIMAVGGLSMITSIISSIAQLLKVSQLSENHRVSYLSWEKFHSTIKFQLNKRRIARENLKDFISIVLPEYQRLKEISADIPQHIKSQVKRNKKALNKMQVPYLLSGFHPVLPYKEESDSSDDGDDTNDNGFITLETFNVGGTAESPV